jgi:hypothetical protein
MSVAMDVTTVAMLLSWVPYASAWLGSYIRH